MKKIAFILSLTMCAGCFACRGNSSSEKPQTVTADYIASLNLSSEDISLPSEITSVYSVYPLSDGEVLVSASTAESVFTLWKSSDSLNVFTEITLGSFPMEFSYDIAVTSDGNILLVYSNGDGSITLRLLSSDGAVISENRAEIDSGNTGFYISGVVSSDGRECILGIDGRYYAADTGGTIYGELKLDSIERTITRAGINSDGGLICLSESGEETAVYTASIKDCRLEDGKTVFSLSESVSGRPLASYDEKYSMLLPTAGGLYGIRREDNIPERLFIYTDLLIEPDNVCGIAPLSDGGFAVAQNSAANTPKLTLLSAETDIDTTNEPVEKRSVKVAVSYKSPELQKAAVRYNNTHDDSRIALVEYGPSDDENSARNADDLRLEIISGDIPDIIDLSLIGGLGLEKFGMYTDLYPFLDSDEELSREAFLPSVFNACEKDGKLLSLPVTCSTVYITAGKTKFLEDFAGLTDEYIMGLAEKYPDKLLYANRTNASDIIFQTFDMNQFIDYESYTCNFESEEFIDILEFCTKYPSEGSYVHEYNENIRSDKALIGTVKIPDIYSISDSVSEMFGDEDYTVLETEFNYGVRLAITESCPDKNGAWEFIRENYDIEMYMDNFVSDFKSYGLCGGIPITAAQFEAQAEFFRTIEQNEDLNLEGHSINKNLTQEQCDLVYDILCGAESCVENMNYDMYMIIYEETTECFGGEITPEECAERIQNRMSILLSERS